MVYDTNQINETVSIGNRGLHTKTDASNEDTKKVYFIECIDNFCGKHLKYIWKCYTKLYDWYYKYFGYETPGTVYQLILKEFVEISIQNIALYYYAGSQHPIIQYFSGYDVILAEDQKNVKLFAWYVNTTL